MSKLELAAASPENGARPCTEGFWEVEQSRFQSLRAFAAESLGEQEYYFSILDGRQKGRIFADHRERPQAVLFWHYAGYAFVAGRPGETFLSNVFSMIKQEHPYFLRDTALQKRIILQQDDPSPMRTLEKDAGILRSERLCFVWEGGPSKLPALPNGYSLQAMDGAILSRISGSVTPGFSWNSAEAFLHNGKGYCVMHGEEAAAWAFSGAIGGGRMDIGVETAPRHRGRGLAKAAAYAMVKEALSMELAPVWGCDISNPASVRTAESIGFVLKCRHGKFKKG